VRIVILSNIEFGLTRRSYGLPGKGLEFPFVDMVAGIGHTQFFIDGLADGIIFFYIKP